MLLRHVYHTYTTLCKFNNSLVSTYEVNSNYIENIDFVKEYLEKNLDIERTVKNKAFTKNHIDGNVKAKIYFTVARIILMVNVNLNMYIVLSFLSRFLIFFNIIFYLI